MTLFERYRLDWIFALLPLPIVAFFYKKLPAQIPTNWNLSGNLVSYSGKGLIWLLALLPLAMLLLFRFLPKIDPKRQNYERFRSYYDGFALFMILFLDGMLAFILSESFRPGHLPIQRIVPFLVGILFIFLGNMLPKVKHNYFMGIRTPWTLADPDVWNRTQRLGGHLFFWCGLSLTVATLFLPPTLLFALLIAALSLICLLPLFFSYYWFRTRSHTEEDSSAHDQ